MPFSISVPDQPLTAQIPGGVNAAITMSTKDGRVRLSPSAATVNTAALTTTLSGLTGAVYAALPNVTLRANAAMNETLPVDYIVYAPNNTFVLLVNLTSVSPAGDVQDISVSQSIVLPSGVGFATGLAQALASQVPDPRVRAAITLVTVPAQPLFNDVAHVQLRLSMTQMTDGSGVWLLPELLSIDSSNVFGLLNQVRVFRPCSSCS